MLRVKCVYKLNLFLLEDFLAMSIIKINIVRLKLEDIFSHYIKVHFAVGKM